MSLAALSPTSELALLRGRTEPRVFTPPLVEGPPGPCGCGCALTPATSFGFDIVEWAAALGRPYDPWQRWVVIHACELRPDGLPRFRKVLVLVSRQNGKTEILVPLAAYWLYVLRVATVLGTSTKLEYAQDSWRKLVKVVRRTPWLMALQPPRKPHGIYQANGQVRLETADDGEYRIAPADEEGGRSKSIALAILDELRQHHDYSSYDAVIPAQSAVPFAQCWMLSNEGGDDSVVLHDLVKAAEAFIASGGTEGDDRLFLASYTTLPGTDPEDVEGLLQSNPSVGYRQTIDELLSEARAAKAAGGDKLTGFLTERMCQRVRKMDGAIDPTAWDAAAAAGSLAGVRSRVVAFIDVSPDEQHVTLVAGARLDDGRVRVEPVEAWEGPTAIGRARADLPALLRRVRPQLLGWLPNGPAAALAAYLRAPGRLPCRVEEVRADTPAVCMGLAEAVRAGDVEHPGDELLDAHVKGAERLRTGDRWVFSRRGGGHCDAAYAVAGAVHLARSGSVGGGPEDVIVVR